HLAGGHAVDQSWRDLPCVVAPFVDLESPRHRGLATVEFLVEPVAEASDGLRQQDRRGESVPEGRQRDPPPTAPDPRTERTEGNRTPDAEATLPDLQGVDRVVAVSEVLLPVGGDVVEPPTDQAE